MISREGDAMSPGDLHVTMWFKTAPGLDRDYEKKLEQLTPTKITINYMYADTNQCSAAGVTLKPELRSVQNVDSFPYLSVQKQRYRMERFGGKKRYRMGKGPQIGLPRQQTRGLVRQLD